MSDKCDCNELPTIQSNDVKKGAVAYFKDGRIGEVIDNRRGNLRMVKVEVYGMPGMYDMGDEYVHNWDTVVQNGVRYKVDHTKSQGKTRDLLNELGWD